MHVCAPTADKSDKLRATITNVKTKNLENIRHGKNMLKKNLEERKIDGVRQLTRSSFVFTPVLSNESKFMAQITWLPSG